MSGQGRRTAGRASSTESGLLRRRDGKMVGGEEGNSGCRERILGTFEKGVRSVSECYNNAAGLLALTTALLSIHAGHVRGVRCR